MLRGKDVVEPSYSSLDPVTDLNIAEMESSSYGASSVVGTATAASLAAVVSLDDRTGRGGNDLYSSHHEELTSATTARADFISSRPILVGYAFGPKKMSTMGIIMAEASKALSTVATAVSPLGADATCLSSTVSSSSSPRRLTTAALEKRGRHFEETTNNMISSTGGGSGGDDITEEDEEVSSVVSLGCPSFISNQTSSSFNGDDGDIGLRFNFCSGNNAGMHNIIRFFRSSCSSAASLADSSITTATAATAGVTQSHTSSARIDVLGKSGDGTNAACMQNIRVSFVPLDLDSPLEEQHGGKFDAILHKMTEDILCLSHNSCSDDVTSRMPCKQQCEDGKGEAFPSSPITAQNDDNALIHATERVGRLVAYKRDHPECCLVDHPSNVQALMSRSDIARVLSDCLVGVTTRDGTPVRTPRFLVIDDSDDSPLLHCLAEQIERAPFTYPLIAKPLTAAGTKESHRMAVVLGRSGLQRIRPPCLLQEYANHGGTLFKVYVLGDAVRVYARPSLPDLPPGDRGESISTARGWGGKNLSSSCDCYVEFDSQRPYPRLSDFGMLDDKEIEQQNNTRTYASSSNNNGGKERSGGCRGKGSDLSTIMDSTENKDKATTQGHKRIKKRALSPHHRSPPKMLKKAAAAGHHLTADEIRPVVTVLKKAFGLELFGFDVLVKKSSSINNGPVGREMLVVDVNYFPSYKEVSNFPSLLAQYLTQRAIEGRMKKGRGNDII